MKNESDNLYLVVIGILFTLVGIIFFAANPAVKFAIVMLGTTFAIGALINKKVDDSFPKYN